MHLSEIWHSKKNDCRLSRTQAIWYMPLFVKHLHFIGLRIILTKDMKCLTSNYTLELKHSTI